MQSLEGLPKSEIRRRMKISKTMKKKIAKKRQDGLRAYWKKKKEEREAHEREKRKEKKRLERERKKQQEKKKKKRKKKPGRKKNPYLQKKKRLAKKKREEEKANRVPTPYLYKIIICRNGKQIKLVGKYKTAANAYERFNKLKFESDKVVFPRMIKVYDDVRESVDECILIEKSDNGASVMRNEYGKLVEQIVTAEGWELLDKFRYNVEEDFWVWGYDNRSERKDFMWIYEILTTEFDSPYEFRRVFIFNNKLLVRYDDGSLSMVICKTTFDSVRLYNELQKRCNEDKEKQVIFVGDKSKLSPERTKLEDEIMAMTGWPRRKVQMKDTTYCTTDLEK